MSRQIEQGDYVLLRKDQKRLGWSRMVHKHEGERWHLVFWGPRRKDESFVIEEDLKLAPPLIALALQAPGIQRR